MNSCNESILVPAFASILRCWPDAGVVFSSGSIVDNLMYSAYHSCYTLAIVERMSTGQVSLALLYAQRCLVRCLIPSPYLVGATLFLLSFLSDSNLHDCCRRCCPLHELKHLSDQFTRSIYSSLSVSWPNDVHRESCRIRCQFFPLHTQYLPVDATLFVPLSSILSATLFVPLSDPQCYYSAGDLGSSAAFDGRPDVPRFAQLLLEL